MKDMTWRLCEMEIVIFKYRIEGVFSVSTNVTCAFTTVFFK